MSFIESFRSFISEQALFTPQQRLLLAVSGGLDSVVLCELCSQCGYDFEIAHCNFQLRGEESKRDEEFVRALANKYNVKVWVEAFDTQAYLIANKLSVQEAARELRYEWFHRLLDTRENRLDVLLTAHHLDDAVETSLMNYFKGTGIAGLRSILPKQNKTIRPLLFTGRKEIREFAAANQLQWVEDSSNASDKYSRNYLRHHLLPVIQQLYPKAEENMRRNIPRFRDIELLYQQAIDSHRKKLLVQKGEEVHIPVLKLQKAIPLTAIVYEIIRPYGFSAAQTTEVIALLNSGSGRYVQSSSHRIIRNRNWLIIASVKAERPSLILIEETGNVSFPAGELTISRNFSSDGKPDTSSSSVAYIDASLIQFPFTLRPWKNGDYFYPLGMRKKKKLARFFIDQKMSSIEKENVWVIESDKRIVWVVGRRLDDRFKMKGAGDIIKISLALRK
ncbi:tRNA lysidine(34) synthetase TilS [Terrimonas sp. NA20]|uniref:tRNA(Ile)-lysidine synthase n=1 Tax=Terrimonas ginsenosidimutans TaxID=2908004 RepID=A0ABS9KXP0_9BACT|nr:tRNA lysidine(34) synthetase TilS [Terrimonas ginsenosidimutans]MCG2617090.1 tRNA lysidine(34) synthetase TilS [Terrimonas ginsenosidimutans]